MWAAKKQARDCDRASMGGKKAIYIKSRCELQDRASMGSIDDEERRQSVRESEFTQHLEIEIKSLLFHS